MNRSHCRRVLDCASPLALWFGIAGGIESGRGLPQSKTLSLVYERFSVHGPNARFRDH